MLKKMIIIASIIFTVHLGAMEKLGETGLQFIERAKKEHLFKKCLLQDKPYSIYSPSKKILISIQPVSPCKLLNIMMVDSQELIAPKRLPVYLKDISIEFDKQERYFVVQGSLSKPRCSRNLSIPYAATFRLPDMDGQ